MMHIFCRSLVMCLTLVLPVSAAAQDLRVATVERPPFSMLKDETQTGFSIELWQAVARDLGRTATITRYDGFAAMLESVQNDTADVAVANISISAEREQFLDFSHSIFQSGLQIMVPQNGESDISLIRDALLSRDLLTAIGIAFLLLFGGGMLMWRLERRGEPYFDRPAREAMFPAFWWALNLIVNGGFEERVPRSTFGRLFGVVLVISSLFFVSVFVAKITAVLTVDAIQGSVTSINDLYGKRVGTISGSTTAAYLINRDMEFATYPDLDSLIAGFEAGELDAVVFDAPILSFYVRNAGRDTARMVGAPFQRESYGFALQTGSPLVEPVNRSLLKLREDGTYDRIYRKYFGALD